MSYADTVRAGAGATSRPPGRRSLPRAGPLRHLDKSHGPSFLIDFQAAKPEATNKERVKFVKEQLKVPPEEVTDFFVDSLTAKQLVTVRSEEICAAAVAQLRRGVVWPAARGARVYGSASADNLLAVRVSAVHSGFPLPHLLQHMARFGVILRHHRGGEADFPNASSGVIHLSMIVADVTALPHYICVVDGEGTLSQVLPVHTDHSGRCCFYCGRTNHSSPWCRFTQRDPAAPESYWSEMVLPAESLRERVLAARGVAVSLPSTQTGSTPPVRTTAQISLAVSQPSGSGAAVATVASASVATAPVSSSVVVTPRGPQPGGSGAAAAAVAGAAASSSSSAVAASGEMSPFSSRCVVAVEALSLPPPSSSRVVETPVMGGHSSDWPSLPAAQGGRDTMSGPVSQESVSSPLGTYGSLLDSPSQPSPSPSRPPVSSASGDEKRKSRRSSGAFTPSSTAYSPPSATPSPSASRASSAARSVGDGDLCDMSGFQFVQPRGRKRSKRASARVTLHRLASESSPGSSPETRPAKLPLATEPYRSDLQDLILQPSQDVVDDSLSHNSSNYMSDGATQ